MPSIQDMIDSVKFAEPPVQRIILGRGIRIICRDPERFVPGLFEELEKQRQNNFPDYSHTLEFTNIYK